MYQSDGRRGAVGARSKPQKTTRGEMIVGPSAGVPAEPPRRGRRALAFDLSGPAAARRLRIAPGFGRRRLTNNSAGSKQQLQPLRPLVIEEGHLSVTSPRSPSPAAGRQLSPDFLNSTRPPNSVGVTVLNGPSLPPIPTVRSGLPSRSSPSTSRQKHVVSPYASAPQGLLPQLGLPAATARSPTARYRVSPRASPPMMLRSSPPALEALVSNAAGPASGSGSRELLVKQLRVRSRGYPKPNFESDSAVAGAARGLSLDMYSRITSPAKLHRQEDRSSKRKRQSKGGKASLPPAFELAALAPIQPGAKFRAGGNGDDDTPVDISEASAPGAVTGGGRAAAAGAAASAAGPLIVTNKLNQKPLAPPPAAQLAATQSPPHAPPPPPSSAAQAAPAPATAMPSLPADFAGAALAAQSAAALPSTAAPPSAAAPPAAAGPAAAVATPAAPAAIGSSGDGTEHGVPPLSALPPLADVLSRALPKGAVGTLQQQADASMMLLRVDWKAADAAPSTTQRCHRALHFIDVLAAQSAALTAAPFPEGRVLQGTLFQALMARHASAMQRKREEEERQREEEERKAQAAEAEQQAQGGGSSGGAAGDAPSAANTPAAAEASSPADALPAGGVADDSAARAMLRSADGAGASGAEDVESRPPCLKPFDANYLDAMGKAGADLRALLRIKIEDDQDLKTAQQALAECGCFLVLLAEEAPKRGLSEQALLKKLDLGEGDN